MNFGHFSIHGGDESRSLGPFDHEAAAIDLLIDLEGQRLRATYALTFEAGYDRDLAGRSDKVDILRLAALDELEDLLRRDALVLDEAKGSPPTRFFTHQEAPSLARLADHKECLWMHELEPRGHECLANHPSSGAETTQPLCKGCDIPDARLICSGLVFPSVGYDPASNLRRRRSLGASCEAGEDAGVGEDCKCGGRPCWRRRGSRGISLPATEADVARKLVDEIDHLNRVYRDYYRLKGKKALWDPPGWRSIAQLTGQCDDEGTFERQIANLACVLATLDPFPQLRAERRSYDDGRQVGNVEALARLLEDDHQSRGATSARELIRVQRARNNCFPVHEHRAEFGRVLSQLGVMRYPPAAGDFQGAWDRVLTSAWSTVRNVRSALQQSLELPSEGSEVGDSRT